MPGDVFRVRICESASKAIRRIGRKFGTKTYETIRDLILDLASEPEKKGEPLRGNLKGLFSRHYSRFRTIYSIERTELVVLVIAAGFHEDDSRSDVYKTIERLLESGAISIRDELSSDSGKTEPR